jgi:hypothetical protein
MDEHLVAEVAANSRPGLRWRHVHETPIPQ